MKSIIRKSETVEMKNLDNLFIELTSKMCTQRCKHCYIDFPLLKKVQDFIDASIIEQALIDLKNQSLKCIYLTGAEPMTHPDFNTILRLCLKKTNTCICTNGFAINEKKARFLKKVENESQNEIFFVISLDHFDEVKNDDIRYRGAYRQAIFAIKHLVKYNFMPIIQTVNYYHESYEDIFNNFVKIFSNIGYEFDEKHLKITPYFDKNSKFDFEGEIDTKSLRTDCMFGRILTSKGIYSCPFLSGDYRGRCGTNFTNYSNLSPLETNCCKTCINAKSEIFGINFANYEY